ncbi:unnamed protein product [marine sediment metagenome]|uniref:Uncharacterized protein n=1 Tax=marine sediment metagenome TaxID=412755 RepID=X1H9D3_9ZZZZ
MTGWDIFWGFLVLVVGGFIAGFVETWREQRKWHKEQRKWDNKGRG